MNTQTHFKVFVYALLMLVACNPPESEISAPSVQRKTRTRNRKPLKSPTPKTRTRNQKPLKSPAPKTQMVVFLYLKKHAGISLKKYRLS